MECIACKADICILYRDSGLVRDPGFGRIASFKAVGHDLSVLDAVKIDRSVH